MPKFLTVNKFIEKAIIVHSNKYDYSLVDYTDAHSKVKIICKEHGLFEQLAYKHLDKRGCPKCGRLSLAKTMAMGLERFVSKAKTVHENKYDYSQVVYINTHTKVNIICSKHGIFLQSPKEHLIGQGCRICSDEAKQLDLKKFISRCLKLHNHNYDYSKVKYKNNRQKINIICPIHGDFWQRPDSHMNGFGCPKCTESLGEKEIRRFLEENNIEFDSQYRIIECRNQKPLPFDFAITIEGKIRGLIEYQGKQHIDSRNFYAQNGNFQRIRLTDFIKAKYCKDHKIPLLIISHTEKNQIRSMIGKFVTTIRS